MGRLFLGLRGVVRQLIDEVDVLAVHLNQGALEAVRLTLEGDNLLLGQLHIIAGALLTVLRFDVGGADNLGCLLLGLADDILAQTLGVNHRGAQGIFHRAVLLNALGQHNELFLQIIVLGGQIIHRLRHLFQISIHVLTAIALKRLVKGYMADILRRDHDFPPVCRARCPVIPGPRPAGRSCAQYW